MIAGPVLETGIRLRTVAYAKDSLWEMHATNVRETDIPLPAAPAASTPGTTMAMIAEHAQEIGTP